MNLNRTQQSKNKQHTNKEWTFTCGNDYTIRLNKKTGQY
jgi:hypothetical protein